MFLFICMVYLLSLELLVTRPGKTSESAMVRCCFHLLHQALDDEPFLLVEHSIPIYSGKISHVNDFMRSLINFFNLTPARVRREEGISTEELPPMACGHVCVVVS